MHTWKAFDVAWRSMLIFFPTSGSQPVNRCFNLQRGPLTGIDHFGFMLNGRTGVLSVGVTRNQEIRWTQPHSPSSQTDGGSNISQNTCMCFYARFMHTLPKNDRGL